MSFQDALTIVATALAAVGGGGTIVLAFSAWLGKVWANRIMEADKARYARELESVKAELSRASEDRTRRLQGLMRHYERQIEEFYGPLLNMVYQIFVANHIQHELLSGDKPLNAADAEKVRDYFHMTYFMVFHDEIREILSSKLYLIEGSLMPESFYHYLKHAAQERDQRHLWKVNGIDSTFLKGEPWPQDFYDDIKSGLDNSMHKYQQCLEGLERNNPLNPNGG